MNSCFKLILLIMLAITSGFLALSTAAQISQYAQTEQTPQPVRTTTLNTLNPLADPVFPNPMKGFMRRQDDWAQTNDLVYTLEVIYMPVNAIVNERHPNGDLIFEWKAFEDALEDIRSRQAMAVVRFYMSEPNNTNAINTIPQYLVDLGYVDKAATNWDDVVRKLKNRNAYPGSDLGMTRDEAIERLIAFGSAGAVVNSGVEFHPNYMNPDVQAFVVNFAEGLGNKYDGDPRIAAFEAGMLGPWGEWIVSTPYDIVPTREYIKTDGSAITYSLYQRLLDAYNKSFQETHILLRDWYSLRATDNIYGFHNDMFGINNRTTTISDYANKVNNSEFGRNFWKSHPIGGEFGPIFQFNGFSADNNPTNGNNSLSYFDVSDGTQARIFLITNHGSYNLSGGGKLDFARDIAQEHTSWLLSRETSRYDNVGYPTLENVRRASSLLGYDLTVLSADFQNNLTTETTIPLEIKIKNRGVAPFYYNWPVYLEIRDQSDVLIKSQVTDWNLTDVLPEGEIPDVTFNTNLDISDLVSGTYTVNLNIPNPMSNGRPLVMANAESVVENGAYTGLTELGTLVIANSGETPEDEETGETDETSNEITDKQLLHTYAKDGSVYVVSAGVTMQEIKVYSLQGVELYQSKLNNTLHTTAKRFIPGVYIVTIKTDNGAISKKIIVN